MKTDSWSVSGVAAGVLLASALCLPPAAPANDYYSWVDANGTVVMTDDTSRVPPPVSRSQVEVHRFAPVPPSPPTIHEPESASQEEQPQAAAVDPRDLNLPLVALDEPEGQARAQYVWVPLLSPLFVGGNSVSGFWWHPGATSPVEAFKQYLGQHYRQQQTQRTLGVGMPYPSHRGMGRGSSGNSVYDQVVSERQALQETIRLRHFPGSPGPAPQGVQGIRGVRGGGHHSIRSR
jgi:hypothetical protein